MIWDFYFPTSGYTHWPLEFGEKPLNPRKGGSTCSLTAKQGASKNTFNHVTNLRPCHAHPKLKVSIQLLMPCLKVSTGWFFFFYFKFSIRCCIIFHDLRKYIREEKEAINRTDESIFLTSEEILDWFSFFLLFREVVWPENFLSKNLSKLCFLPRKPMVVSMDNLCYNLLYFPLSIFTLMFSSGPFTLL